MLIAIDIDVQDLENCLSENGNETIVHLDSSDMDLFKEAIRLSEDKLCWDSGSEEFQRLVDRYGFDESIIPQTVFDADFWCETVTLMNGGVDVRFFYTEGTGQDGRERRINISGSPMLDIINVRTVLDEEGFEKYTQIALSGKKWKDPDPSVDDDICWWVYWTGVPKATRGIIITAIRKLMSEEKNHGKFVSTLYDSDTGKLVFP